MSNKETNRHREHTVPASSRYKGIIYLLIGALPATAMALMSCLLLFFSHSAWWLLVVGAFAGTLSLWRVSLVHLGLVGWQGGSRPVGLLVGISAMAVPMGTWVIAATQRNVDDPVFWLFGFLVFGPLGVAVHDLWGFWALPSFKQMFLSFQKLQARKSGGGL